MQIHLIHVNGIALAEIISDKIEIRNAQDALDIMANCGYQGAERIILYEKNIVPEFFDLKTGIAGEILQKFSNYHMQLALVGDYSKYFGKSLSDFIFESNKQGRINFTGSLEEAKEKLIR